MRYKLKSGSHTKWDADQGAHVRYGAGDELELTAEEVETLGDRVERIRGRRMRTALRGQYNAETETVESDTEDVRKGIGENDEEDENREGDGDRDGDGERRGARRGGSGRSRGGRRGVDADDDDDDGTDTESADWSAVAADSTVAELARIIAGLDDVDEVSALRDAEKDGKNRKGVVDAAEARIEELEGA